MAQPQEARVPDIGDYSDVPVIEVLVAVGDTVQKDQGLITLESDKATLEVPAAFGGVVGVRRGVAGEEQVVRRDRTITGERRGGDDRGTRKDGGEGGMARHRIRLLLDRGSAPGARMALQAEACRDLLIRKSHGCETCRASIGSNATMSTLPPQ